MATMNISLPSSLKDWVESRAEAGVYANSSDYVRDLIRRDQERQGKVEAMQRLVDEGLSSGLSDTSSEAIFAAAKASAAKQAPEA